MCDHVLILSVKITFLRDLGNRGIEKRSESIVDPLHTLLRFALLKIHSLNRAHMQISDLRSTSSCSLKISILRSVQSRQQSVRHGEHRREHADHSVSALNLFLKEITQLCICLMISTTATTKLGYNQFGLFIVVSVESFQENVQTALRIAPERSSHHLFRKFFFLRFNICFK